MRKLFFLFVSLVATTTLWAYDFQSGNLYYNITSSSAPYTVEVTYDIPRSGDNPNPNIKDVIIIPESVHYQGITYSVTRIGDEAFNWCDRMSSISIPLSITSIGRAFNACYSLTSITIPNGIVNIDENAFFLEYCPITSVVLTAPNVESYCKGKVNELLSRGGCTAPRKIVIDGNEITEFIIPNTIENIPNGTFNYCSYLTSITIPNGIKSIGDAAFRACSSLTSITCEATTPPSLGVGVFDDCARLGAIYIPDNTLSAYQQAWGTAYSYFNNESVLTLYIETPGALEDLIFDAGIRPINVAKLTLTGTLNDADFTCMRETMTSLVDVDLSGITNTSGVYFKNKTNLIQIILPTNLTSIGSSAFQGCSSLTSITIPNSVTSIGNRAFGGCSSLTSISIPNSVTSIGSSAFQGCYVLSSVIIGNGVTSIGDAVFSSCSSLTSVTIPNSVTSIGSSAFQGCYVLSSITIGNGVTSIGDYAFENCYALSSITLPNSVTSIGDYAFSFCSELTSITIPNSVTSIGNAVFWSCQSLASVTIGNNVTSIGNNAFSFCSELTSITIPNSVTSIGESAFSGCHSITSVTCFGTTPPNASNLGANTTTCTLTVPQSAYNAYLRHNYWGQFLNINTGYLVTLQANNDQWGEVAGTNLYTQDTTITITATPYEGYTFMRWSDGNTDNPRTLTVTQDTTLTAEFAIEGGCLVTFLDWDGTVLSTVSVALGNAATAPANPTREGYTFIGWDKDFSNVTDHMTVTAQYQINRYRVRFFDYNDTLLKTDSIDYQSAATAPANPYREGYTFIGWDKDFESITADLDVYAQYEFGEDRDMTIVFTNSEDNDNEIYSQSLTIKMPPAIEIEGFTFLGWQPVATLITDAITIQAIYEPNTNAAAPEVYVNPANPAQKLLRNGQVYILQDGKTYTVIGQEL